MISWPRCFNVYEKAYCIDWINYRSFWTVICTLIYLSLPAHSSFPFSTFFFPSFLSPSLFRFTSDKNNEERKNGEKLHKVENHRKCFQVATFAGLILITFTFNWTNNRTFHFPSFTSIVSFHLNIFIYMFINWFQFFCNFLFYLSINN